MRETGASELARAGWVVAAVVGAGTGAGAAAAAAAAAVAVCGRRRVGD